MGHSVSRRSSAGDLRQLVHQPDFCHFLDQQLHLAYVGTLGGSDRIHLQKGPITLEKFAQRRKAKHLAALQSGGKPIIQRITIPFKGVQETCYSYCNIQRLHSFGRQCLVINHRQSDLSATPTFFISNRLTWHAAGITHIRRHRWPVEVYHEDGKAEGLDQDQLRDFAAIECHIALDAVVYSLLCAAQHDHDLRAQLQRLLQVNLEDHPAAGRRTAQAQRLWCLGLFLSAGLAHGQPLQEILAPEIRAICRT